MQTRAHNSKSTAQRATFLTLLALLTFAVTTVLLAGLEFHPTETRQVIRPILENIAQPSTGGGERPDQKVGARLVGDRWRYPDPQGNRDTTAGAVQPAPVAQ
jgi:hypothetical protein